MSVSTLKREWLLILLWGTCLGCRPEQREEPKSPPGPQVSSVAPFEPDEATIAEHNRAVALMGYFDYDAAYAVLEQLAEAHPAWLDVRVDWAIAALNRRQEGDSAKALSLLNDVLAKTPQDLRARYCQGILWLDAGETAKAFESFQFVADQDPADAYALYYAGLCQFQLGKPDLAVQRYERAIQSDPYLRSGYYGAFQAFAQLGQRDRSLDYMQQFQRLEGNPQARLAEIKYTRMGPKATLHAIDASGDVSDATPPQGPVFGGVEPLAALDQAIHWSNEPAAGTHVSVVEFGAGQPLHLVLAGAGAAVESPNVILRANDAGAWTWLPEHPLANITEVTAICWGDYDNDGYVDAYVCRAGPNQLWRQVGRDVWEDVTEATGTGGDQRTVDAQFFDADHDGDLDLLLINDGPNELFNNNLNGTFRPLAAEQGLAGKGGRSRSAIVLDIDRDRDLDYWVINEASPNELYLNDRLWTYRQVGSGQAEQGDEGDEQGDEGDAALALRYRALTNTTVLAAVALDMQSDGQAEVLALTPDGLTLFAPDAAGVWQARLLEVPGITSAEWQPMMSVADLDGDGDSELLVATVDGWAAIGLDDMQVVQRDAGGPVNAWSLVHADPVRGPSLVAIRQATGVCWLPGPGRFEFLTISFTGKEEKADQMRSNRSGIGVDAAARMGTQWVSVRTLRNDSGPGQSLQPLSIGLGGRPRLDFVRMTWPDGVFQTELDLSAGRRHEIAETQRQVASCPVVFAWNGTHYEFVTDVLGVGGIGFNLARGEYGTPRPWENLLLPTGCLQPKHGRYRLKIGEPMEEVCYLDAARLVVYDLPAGWELTVDERFAINGPAPTGQPIFYRLAERLTPIAAVNDRGASILPAIAARDLVAAEPGAPDPRFIGRTDEHFVELAFAQPVNGSQPYLLFDGWIEYPYSQTMFAAWQAGAAFDAPTIEALDPGSGRWRVVVEQFGYMAGMPRQAVVPLDPARLPAGTTRLRIRCNVEIYWDYLAIIQAAEPPECDRRELPLLAAEVAQVGFALRTTKPQRLPHYDYQQRAPLWDTRHPKGAYSRFGSALPLLTTVDDALAIIGPGEEIQLEFQAPEPPASGFAHRRLVLEFNGWCKDMDLFTRDGETVTPLPTRTGVARTAEQERRRGELHQENHVRYAGGY